MKNLYKTTIVIWTEEDPTGTELDELAREATELGAYCSKQVAVLVLDPQTDPDWDGTEFFGDMQEPPACPLCACAPKELCGDHDCHHCQPWASGRDVGWLEQHEAGDDDDFRCLRGECCHANRCNGNECLATADEIAETDESEQA